MAESSLAAARALLYLLLMTAAGLPLYRLCDGGRSFSGRARGGLVALAVLALLTSLWWTLAAIASMAALPIGALDGATVQAVLDATPLGLLLWVRLGALAAFALAALVLPRPAVLALAGVIALASIAWSGHAGAAEGISGTLHRMADVSHLLAAALWLGALFAFLAAGLRGRFDIGSLGRFARTGTVVVAVLVVTGTANALFITGVSGWSARGPWTLLIAAKIGLFCAMLGFAAHNRWRLVPAAEIAPVQTRPRLMRSLMLETACALLILVLIAFAGTLDPSGAG
ncbi:copper homeostasis membrane protein CopD [Novosphingobium colocasiae]|uniref:Copper resistance protein D domain-containing protein n=1 Tax=Novosphingobium colocasiae TaxID=1256513 RepID=A0A918UH48_9SPHN|nr:copper homeostasis membrane protein CopD [Novosphingobium colocasiae]GGZ07787.1 hypothetical protein GCM10011614_23410 [Novosphingobium colocasiae]